MTPSGPSPELEAVIESRRQAVNEAIPEHLPVKEPTRLWEASRYLMDAGGKRLRPTVLLLTAESLRDRVDEPPPYRSFPTFDGAEVDVLSAAISVEIIQTFTLIHDDIMDADSVRRGVETVHERYDLETAILAGDTLYAKSFEVMLNAGGPVDRGLRSIRLLAETCTAICEGQARDVGYEGDPSVMPAAYLEMIEAKTAVLYATAAAIPGILLGADETTIDELYAFGLDFGRAFQIKDDLLDLTGDTDTLGKDQGSDLMEGKQTIVTIHGRAHGVDLQALIDDDPANIGDAVAALREAGSLGYANDLATDYVRSAKDHLRVLPDNDARERLVELTDFVVEREY